MTVATAAGSTAMAAGCGDIQVRLAGVSSSDGRTALTRIRRGRNSSANGSVIRTTAALLMAWATGAAPMTAVLDPTVTIEPPPAPASWGDHQHEGEVEEQLQP